MVAYGGTYPIRYAVYTRMGQGHSRDTGFHAGAEFDVRFTRRVDVPQFARVRGEQWIEEIWWQRADQYRAQLMEDLSRKYLWVGRSAFCGRGPGWLAIEDTRAKEDRDWEPIAKIVKKRLREFLVEMESDEFWRQEMGD